MESKPIIGINETMFTLLIFLIGSSLILTINLDAERNSWLVPIIAGGVGIGLFQLYSYIWKNNECKSLAHILQKNFGKHLGLILSIIYVLYFVYLASRILSDFTFFINKTLL